MKRLRKQQLLEQSIYGAIWIVIFLLPLIGGYFALSGGLEREEVRTVIRDSWLGILPFFEKILAIYCFIVFPDSCHVLACSVSFHDTLSERLQA